MLPDASTHKSFASAIGVRCMVHFFFHSRKENSQFVHD